MVSSVTNGGRKVGKRRGLKPGQRHAGQFGNPGRDARAAAASRWTPERRSVSEMARADSAEAYGKIIELMRTCLKPDIVRDCAALILAYADGKPRQAVDVSVNTTREISSLSTAELEAIAAGSPPPFQLTHQGEIIDAEVIEEKPLQPVTRKRAIRAEVRAK